MAFVVPADNKVKVKESEKRDKYKDFARELKNLSESDGDASCNWCAWYCHQKIGTKTGGLEYKRTNAEQVNDNIFEISQNTKKSPGDLRKLAVTQTPVENHQLKLGWKTLKRVK